MLLPHCRVRCRFPWDTVSVANWLKYPNTHTPHVLHVDYLQRYVDPATGQHMPLREHLVQTLDRIAGHAATHGATAALHLLRSDPVLVPRMLVEIEADAIVP